MGQGDALHVDGCGCKWCHGLPEWPKPAEPPRTPEPRKEYCVAHGDECGFSTPHCVRMVDVPDPRLAELEAENARLRTEVGAHKLVLASARIGEETTADRLAELIAAANVLKGAWADTVRCNRPLAAAIEKTLAAVAAFEEEKCGE